MTFSLWAQLGDVLSYYQDSIANEAYLGGFDEVK